MSKNVIWEFFKKSGTDPSKAQCNECCKLLSLGSDKPRNQNCIWIERSLIELSYGYQFNIGYMLKAKDDGSEKAAHKLKVDNIANKRVLPNFVQTSLNTAIEKGSTWPDDHPQQLLLLSLFVHEVHKPNR